MSRTLAFASASVLLVSCASDGAAEDDAAPSPPTSAAPTGPPEEPTAGPTDPTEAPSPTEDGVSDAPAGDATSVDVAVTLEPVASLEQPVATALRPGEDDALYVAERPGRVRVVRGGQLVDEPVLDIGAQTTTDSERGLLGIAFADDGGELYVSHTDPAGDSRVAAYAIGDATDVGDGAVDPASRRELLAVEQPFANHNGGEIVVGPDGLLWIGLGDGGDAGDPEDNGQDRTTLLGSILRIDPDGGDPYGIPDDNPFVGDDTARAEIWAYGLRNPWRFSFDRATDDLWIADVGQGDREEVNLLPAGEGSGANLGWNRLEGTLAFEGEAPPAAVPPVFEYDHADGRCSVTGGRVYRGSALAELTGVYVYGDFCSGELRGLLVDDDGAVLDEAGLGVTVPGLVAVGEDAAGELYTLSLEGELAKVVP